MKIKKNLLLVLFSFMLTAGFSQQFTGFNVDNYAGINGVLENPAYLAGSKYKIYVNLAAINFLGGNNAYEFDRKRIFSLKFSNFSEGNGVYKTDNTDKKYLYANIDIVGPSVMFNINSKTSIALITRARVISNGKNLSNNTFRLLGNSDPAFYNLDIQEQNVQAKMNSFGEAGISFGRILVNNGTHFLKAGITGKYIMGLAAGYAHSNQMLVNITPAKLINKLNGDFDLQYSSNIDNLSDNNISDLLKNKSGNSGWGLDLGLQYEWRPTAGMYDATPYKMRFSLSVTDLGSVRYANSTHGKSYLLNGIGHPTTDLAKADGETYDQYFSRLQTSAILVPVSLKDKLNISLPTAIRANVDYHIFKGFFVNVNGLVNMVGKNSLSANYVSTVGITPRFERKWFSVYSPVSYNMDQQLSWGVGFRAGPLFAGSGSILSNVLGKDRMTATDFHLGLSIPIYQRNVFKKKKEKKEEEEKKVEKEEKPKAKEPAKVETVVVKDRDKDGVPDDKDDCPDSAGVVALNGCPDKDGDGIPDVKDKCPDIAGVAKYNGCPIPDTDHDGINDEEDKCPTVPGVAENQGCPAVKAETVKKVAGTAKKIYFITGKTNLLKQSFPRLNELAAILKADPSLRLTIDGYSDNIGTDERNAMFSSGRANAVKDYLVKKGISEDRLTAVGHGAADPIADNNTFLGRCKNRRVEMHLQRW